MTYLRPPLPDRAAGQDGLNWAERRRGAARWRRDSAAFAALALLMLLPMAAARIPLLVDYPVHLARLHVLATGAASPALRAMFRIDWSFIPNMTMDLVVPRLAQVMPLTLAGKLFIALAMLLPPLGVIALHRAWFGRRSWWPWIAVLPAVNAFLLYGRLNYLVGLGLALLGAAWHARRPVGAHGQAVAGTAAVAAGWGVLCLMSHIVAFGLLLLLMVSTEIGRWAGGAGLARRAVPLAAAASLPLVLGKLAGPAHSAASADVLTRVAGQILRLGLRSEAGVGPAWLLAGFTGQGVAIGVVAALLVLLPLVLAAWRRRLGVAPPMLLAFAGAGVCCVLLPAELVDHALVYQRLSLPLALVGIAGVNPRLRRGMGQTLAAAVLLVVAWRSAAMTRLWAQQDRMVAEVEQVIAPIPPGARVLAVRDAPAPLRRLLRSIADQHLPALVTLERDAFWPMIFTAAGEQPVALRPPYAQQAQSDGDLPLTWQLGPALARAPVGARCGGVMPDIPCQLYAWPQRYDYLLRFAADADAAAPPGAGYLRQVARAGWVTLYLVLPSAPAGR